MFVIETSTASSADSLALVISAMRSGSEVMILVAVLSAALWMPARARRQGVGFDAAKVDALVRFVGGLVLLAISVPFAYHAFASLLRPAEYDARTVIVVLCLGICVNIACASMILRQGSIKVSTGHGSETPGPGPLDVPEARPMRVFSPHHHLAAMGQLIDAEASVALLVGVALADLCDWMFIDALAGLGGAFVLSISASKIVMREGAVLIDLSVSKPDGP